MFYRSTEVGVLCNNAWGEEKRLKGSQLKRKQTETYGCVFARRSAQLRQEENQQTPTHRNKHHTLAQQMVTCLFHTCALSILWVCVRVCARSQKCLCQGADHSRHGPKQARVSARRTQRDRRESTATEWGGWSGEKKKQSRGEKKKGWRKEQDYTAVDCRRWMPATVWIEEFVSLWWCFPVSFSSLSPSASSCSFSSCLTCLQVLSFPSPET